MENIDEFQKRSILAAETYLFAKRNMLPATLRYVFTDTYNYLLTKIKRYV
jgi:hypothetical protein